MGHGRPRSGELLCDDTAKVQNTNTLPTVKIHFSKLYFVRGMIVGSYHSCSSSELLASLTAQNMAMGILQSCLLLAYCLMSVNKEVSSLGLALGNGTYVLQYLVLRACYFKLKAHHDSHVQ